MLKLPIADLIADGAWSIYPKMWAQFFSPDFARGFERKRPGSVRLRPFLERAIEASDRSEAVALDAPADSVVRVKEAALLRAVESLLTNAHRYGKRSIGISDHIQDGYLRVDMRSMAQGGPESKTPHFPNFRKCSVFNELVVPPAGFEPATP